MPQNGIYHEGISALADAFSVNPNLKVINLNDNTFTERGAASMSRAISRLHNIEVINFGDCLLKTDGAKSVAAVLKIGHSKLKEVHLGFNEIRQEGGEALAESMQGKNSVELLDIDGNQFGEEGCERISAILEEMDKLQVLGSLEDDEGDGGDDEEEEEEEDDDDEYVDEDDDQQEPSSPLHPSPLKASTPAASVVKPAALRPEQATAKEFLERPTAARLLGLGNNRGELLVRELGDVTPEKAVDCYIKVSTFVGEENSEVREAACQCADAVFKEAFKHADKTGNVSLISNTILLHLGLIKSEDKQFRPAVSLLGPLTVLEYVIRQPYFPRNTKEILQVFLSRPTTAVEACGTVKHRLMQTLYQF
jgi:Ran GTPase-activating protein 1